MFNLDKAGTFRLGDRTVKRIGYGAMQLAGPGVFGPPKDRDAALAVLREAVAQGADTIEAIGDATKACTGCGSCKTEVTQILARAPKGVALPLVAAS
jgi:bacterioferritin-associated ferredoxin